MARLIEFDQEKAIDDCMHVFWEKGYDRTSISDLEDRTGLVRTSLYNAFGNKEQLYKVAIQHFIGNKCAYWTDILLSQKDFITGVDRLMSVMIKENFDAAYPTGCLITYSAAGIGSHSEEIAEQIISGHVIILSGIKEGLKKGIQSGEFEASLDVDSFALYILNNFQGIMVLSKTVGSVKNLNQIKEITLTTLKQNKKCS